MGVMAGVAFEDIHVAVLEGEHAPVVAGKASFREAFAVQERFRPARVRLMAVQTGLTAGLGGMGKGLLHVLGTIVVAGGAQFPDSRLQCIRAGMARLAAALGVGFVLEGVRQTWLARAVRIVATGAAAFTDLVAAVLVLEAIGVHLVTAGAELSFRKDEHPRGGSGMGGMAFETATFLGRLVRLGATAAGDHVGMAFGAESGNGLVQKPRHGAGVSPVAGAAFAVRRRSVHGIGVGRGELLDHVGVAG